MMVHATNPPSTIDARTTVIPILFLRLMACKFLMALSISSSTHYNVSRTNWCSAPTRTIELKDNTVIVVLGASGDLAKKKTVGPTTEDHNWLR